MPRIRQRRERQEGNQSLVQEGGRDRLQTVPIRLDLRETVKAGAPRSGGFFGGGYWRPLWMGVGRRIRDDMGVRSEWDVTKKEVYDDITTSGT